MKALEGILFHDSGILNIDVINTTVLKILKFNINLLELMHRDHSMAHMSITLKLYTYKTIHIYTYICVCI